MRRAWAVVLVAVAGTAAPGRARAADLTNVASSFDEDNPFDFRFRVRFDHTEKRGQIKREFEGLTPTQARILTLRDLVYAQSRDTPLLETLEALSARRWIRRAAARQLGIHINSMSYRVERIQTLTGLSLDDPETRVAISIALRARAMLGM